MNTERPAVAVTSPMRFGIGDIVRHLKTNHLYSVVGLPTDYVLEKSGEPAYAYRVDDGRICIRCQSEFEDGRFVLWSVRIAPRVITTLE